MSNTWVIRIRNSQPNEGQEMTLCTEYLDSRIRIVILRNNFSPVLGEVETSQLWDLAKNTFPESEENFYQETKNVLSGKDTEFEFSLEEGNFEWRKGIWTRGFIKVCQVNEINIFSNLIQNFLLNAATGKIDSSTLQTENEKLKNSLALLKDQLEEMIEIKNSMEKVLYSQFILVLNTKKRKIRELLEEIKSLKRKIENSVYDQSTDTEISDVEGEKTKDLKENKVIITEIVEDTKKTDLKAKKGKRLKAKTDESEIIKKSATFNADILNPKPSTSKQSEISYERVISSPPISRKSLVDDRFARNFGVDPSEINRESKTVTADEILNPQPSTSKQLEEISSKEGIDSPQVSRKSSLEDRFEVGDYEVISSPPVFRKSLLDDRFARNVGADISEINRETETVTADEILNPQPSTSKQTEKILTKEVVDSPKVSRKSSVEDRFEVGDYEFISSPPVFRKSPLDDSFAKNVGVDLSEINRESGTVTADEILNPQPSTSKQTEEILNKEVIGSLEVTRKSSSEDGFEVGDYEFDDIINEVINVQPTASKRDAENSSDEMSSSPAKIPRQTSEFTETDDEDFELKDEGDSFEKANINLTRLNITDVEPEEDLFSESF